VVELAAELRHPVLVDHMRERDAEARAVQRVEVALRDLARAAFVPARIHDPGPGGEAKGATLLRQPVQEADEPERRSQDADGRALALRLLQSGGKAGEPRPVLPPEDPAPGRAELLSDARVHVSQRGVRKELR